MINIKQLLLSNGFIPWDKSWIIRMGIQDILNGYDDIINFLRARFAELPSDLASLLSASETYIKGNKEIYVGESATLYRFLKFISWIKKDPKEFVLSGTLRKRKICDDPQIIEWSAAELLQLDGGTSQWASAAALTGSTERIKNPPFKLQATYDAIKHWQARRSHGKLWEPRYDETIIRQAIAFWEAVSLKQEVNFLPQQAEDYYFARVFNLIAKEQGEERWPSLRGHESNRICEMECVINAATAGNPIKSRDHRVVQAISMWAKLKGLQIVVARPNCVNKSWPKFWDYILKSQEYK